MHNFFDGSAAQLVDSLLDPSSRKLKQEELDQIADLVRQAQERRDR